MEAGAVMAGLQEIGVGEVVTDPALMNQIERGVPAIGEVVTELPASAPPPAETPAPEPQAVTTPIPVGPSEQEVQEAEKFRGSFQTMLPHLGTPPSVERLTARPENITRAANAGVQFDKPAPGGQFTASLAIDEKNRIKAFKQSLAEQGIENPQIRVGEQTGELEYLDPETNRWSLVHGAGANLGDLAGIGGTALIMAPELILGGAAAVLTRSPAMTALGASGGAFMGELARLYGGQMMGINDDVSDEEIATSAAKEAGISLASSTAMGAAVKIARFAGRLVRGEHIPKEMLDSLKLSDLEAQRIQDQINDRLAGARLQFSLAQSTGDERLLAWQESLRLSPEFHREFGPFMDAQQDALRSFLTNISRPYRTRTGLEETTEQVANTARAQAMRQVERQEVFNAMERSQLNRLVADLRTSPLEDAGPLIRSVADTEYQAFRGWARARAAELNEIAGDTPIIANRHTSKAAAGLSQEARNILIPSLRSRIQRFLGAESPDMADEAGAALDEVSSRLFDPNAKFTFGELWQTTSALKELVRASSTGAATDAPDVGVMKKLISAMHRDMDEGMGETPLRGLYDDFRRTYAAEKDRLDRGVVQQVMRRQGGDQSRYVINDESVFRQFVRPKNKAAAQDLFNLVNEHPEQMRGVRESINDLYRREVINDNGRIDPRKHDRFIEDYTPAMSVFFSKKEVGQIQKIGGMEKALRAREQDLKRMTERARETFEFQVGSITRPGQLLATIMNRNQPGDAAKLMEIIADDATLTRAVRAHMSRETKERVMGQYMPGTRERIVSPAKLDEFLNGKSGERGLRESFEAVMGKQYVEDLDVLNQAVQIAARESRVTNRSNTSAGNKVLGSLVSAYLGPLSRLGHRINRALSIQQVAAQRAVARAIMNPRSLRELIEARGMDVTTDKAVALISALGGTGFYQFQE